MEKESIINAGELYKSIGCKEIRVRKARDEGKEEETERKLQGGGGGELFSNQSNYHG